MSLSYTTGNPNNLTGGGGASMNDIQGPFVDIKTFLTDGSGAVGDTILASPNNAAWETVTKCQQPITGLTTASWYAATNGMNQSGVGGSLTVQGLWVPPTAGDVAVAGKTTRLRLQVPWIVNSTVPGINVTWGLYPITGTSGGSSAIIVTMGTVIAGSTAAQASAGFAAGQGFATSTSFDFSAVTGAVAYIIGVTGSGSQAAASVINCEPILQMRHT